MVKVSIIIPTLNRAHLLRSALKSAAEQDYKDLEIVVCDDYSEDNTKEVAESFENRNIVYVRTDKRLNMPDTFEFALAKATGEYLTFLTDACYLLPSSISIAVKELEKFNSKIAMWRHCGYFGLDWFEPNRRNVLYIPKVTLKSYLLDSKKSLEKFYNNIREPVIPKSINSLCHRSIIEKAIAIQGRFFLPPTPDHASAVAMLVNTPNFIFIDEPLFVGGVSSVNIGSSQSFNLGKSAQNFLKGFEGKKIDEIAFLGIYTTSALIIKTLENVRSFYLDKCPQINIKNALLEIVDSLSKLEIYGAKVGEYWQILNQYLFSQPKEIKSAIFKKKVKSRLKWFLIKTIRSLPYFYYLETLRNMDILKGNKFQFNNIEEVAQVVEHKIKEKNLNIQ